MDEVKFVLKSLLMAFVFLMVIQIQVGHKTIEGHIEATMINSHVANFLNRTAQGGAQLIRDTGEKVKDLYYDWKHSNSRVPSE